MSGIYSSDSQSDKRKEKSQDDDYTLLMLYLMHSRPDEIPDELAELRAASNVLHDPNHPDNALYFSDFQEKYLSNGALEKFKSSGIGLLDMIAKHESGGNYNIVYGGGMRNLTTSTINDVLKIQDGLAASKGSSAAGKYQIMRYTMRGLIKEMGLTGDELFDEKMQDRMAVHLLNRRGYQKFLNNEISVGQFVKNLSMEWASLPKDASGKSYYAGDKMGNKAFYSYEQTFAAVVDAKDQGTKGLFNADAKNAFASVNKPVDVDILPTKFTPGIKPVA
ncbi:MAG: hypothetical protein ACT4OY_02850 [Alphaproteobacteria bacterium]